MVLLKYRFHLPGFDLPKAVDVAQQKFDDRIAEALDGMRIASRVRLSGPTEDFEDSCERLEHTAGDVAPTAQLQTFLTLSRNLESVTRSLTAMATRC
jgi:multidrug resistance protein MdtO